MIKFIHTRYKVSDIERSVAFYEKLGFTVVEPLRKSPQGNDIIFMGLPGNDHKLEFTCTKDMIPTVPEDLVHVALGVPDIISYCDDLEKKGISIWPDGWREKFKTGLKMAFVTDPDGYEVEILERR